jgi:hypothetical protein
MTRRSFSSLFLAAAGRAAGPPKSLFNGHDLDGWHRAGHGIWTVEDGAIVGRFDRAKPGPGYVFTDNEYTDFDLRLEFWISPQGNSGVFIRQPLREFGTTGDARPAHSPGDGVEVQIDYNDPKNMTGAIYDLHQPSSIRGGEEQWVKYRIVCTGPKVDVWINGGQVNSYDGLKSLKGAIGFQMHGQKPHDHVVKFRNIEIAI